jgi:hypothetical protein
MATIKKLENIDPYLIWADRTDFQGFIENYPDREEAYPVLLSKLDGKDYVVDPVQIAVPDKFTIRLSVAQLAGRKTYAGHLNTVPDLVKVAEDPNTYLELSTARYRESTAAGGGADSADEVKLTKGVIAIIDFGCPFAHEQYLFAEDNELRTRVRYFWDQDPMRTVLSAREFDSDALKHDDVGRWWYPVDKFFYGREMSSPVMERLIEKCRLDSGAVDEDAVYRFADYASVDVPVVHGAHVMDLAAGKINPRTGLPDAASQADIIFVQLPRSTVADTSGGSMSMYLHDALQYIHDKTKDAKQVVINLSFGATAGPHDGSSLIEQIMDAAIKQMRVANKAHREVDLVIAAGNHYLARLHAQVSLSKAKPCAKLHWEVLPDDTTDSFAELWFPNAAASELQISLRSPSGVEISSDQAFGVWQAPKGKLAVAAIIRIDNTRIHKNKCCALIALGPTEAGSWAKLEHGVWTIEIKYTGNDAHGIDIDAWIERDDPLDWEPGAQQGGFISTRPERELDVDDIDIDNDCVKRSFTGNKLAFGQETIVAGSYVAGSEHHSVVSGELLGFELSHYTAAGKRANKPWPNYIAPTDGLAQGTGIWASGTRSGEYFRTNGTSMAAPQVVRYLVNRRSIYCGQSPKSVLPSTNTLQDERGILAERLV